MYIEFFKLKQSWLNNKPFQSGSLEIGYIVLKCMVLEVIGIYLPKPHRIFRKKPT